MNFLLLSSGPSKGQLYTLKRTTFGIQKSPFYIANVVLLHCKRTTFLDIVCEHQFVTHILYVSDGEEFGLLSFEILVVGLYQFHVSLNVACRHKHVLTLY